MQDFLRFPSKTPGIGALNNMSLIINNIVPNSYLQKKKKR